MKGKYHDAQMPITMYHLKWRHLGAMASQVTDKSTLCPSAYSAWHPIPKIRIIKIKSYGASWRLNPLTNRPFVHQLIHPDIQETPKIRITGSSYGESTNQRWTKGQWCGTLLRHDISMYCWISLMIFLIDSLKSFKRSILAGDAICNYPPFNIGNLICTLLACQWT